MAETAVDVAEAPAGMNEQADDPDAFALLLKQEFKPRDESAEKRISDAVQLFASEVVDRADLVSGSAVKTLERMITHFDELLSRQINEILHHDEFQRLEGSWRGLHYLVNNTETDEMLKIKVLNIKKKELGDTLDKFEGLAWDQSPVFKMIYTQEYSMFGGEPYGCLVGDYYFDHSPKDVALLGNMANICAASHMPFIAGANPTLFDMESWQELMEPRDLTAKVKGVTHAKWQSLRESEDSRYIGLALPRVLSRLPYGQATDPVDEFGFEEDVDGSDHHKYAWMNAAWAMATNINRSFKYYGWCTRIRGVESGGLVTDLPVHTFPTTDGSVDMKVPTEIAIDDRREAELAKNGLMPILHRKGTDKAAFIGAQSLQQPKVYEDPDATANANLSARLPYIFAVCRFAHYLKSIARDKIGSFKERDDMQNWLQRWINQYVDGNPAHSSEETKAKRPLRAAEVSVNEVEGNPGYYDATFWLRPHYQLEGLNVSLRLVSKLPSVKGS